MDALRIKRKENNEKHHQKERNSKIEVVTNQPSNQTMQDQDKETWREMVSQLGLSEPKLHITKPVTKTDASKDQNRYELSIDDMYNSASLSNIAIHANAKPQVDVKILDKKGREYQLKFKFIDSNGRYRFMGAEWGRFMKNNGLKEGQTMKIWGLHDGRGRDYGFAFINRGN